MKIKFRTMILTGLTASCVAFAATAQQPDVHAHVAALKESLARSKQQLMKYQWTETEVVLLNGEEKSRKQYMAHYGPDGTVQKVLTEAPPETKQRGLRGHVIEKKKEEMTEYMKRAVNQIKAYVPPDPAKIQAAMASGKVSMDIVEPGKRIRLHFRDYLLPGDDMAVDLDPSTRRILGANVKTYLDDPKDSVTMAIRFGELPDGTMYPSNVDLNAPAKNLTVQVTNSDYRLIGA
jgi:hypothetical protein